MKVKSMIFNIIQIHHIHSFANNNVYLQAVCPPLWDGASCVPPTAALDTATFPCMEIFNFQRYDVTRKYILLQPHIKNILVISCN